MKWLTRLIKKIFIVVIILIIVIVFGRNVIIKYGAPIGAKISAGLSLGIDDVNIGLTDSDMQLKGITLKNPKGFPKENMIDIPEVYVNYHLTDILKDKIHVEEIKLDLKEARGEKNAEGKIKVNERRPPKKDKPKEPGEPEEPKEEKKKKKKELQIDKLKLKIGKVVYKDYTVAPPKITNYEVNIDEEINNVNTASLVSYITGKAMMNTELAKIANINIDDFTGAATDALKKAGKEQLDKTVKDLGDKAKDTLKGLGL